MGRGRDVKMPAQDANIIDPDQDVKLFPVSRTGQDKSLDAII